MKMKCDNAIPIWESVVTGALTMILSWGFLRVEECVRQHAEGALRAGATLYAESRCAGGLLMERVFALRPIDERCWQTESC